MKVATQLARAVATAAKTKAHELRRRPRAVLAAEDIVELADLVEQLAEVVAGLADTVTANPPR